MCHFENLPLPVGEYCLVWWWGSWLITMQYSTHFSPIDFSHITHYYGIFVTTPYSQLSAWIFKKNHKESSKTIWDFRMTSIVPVPTSKLSISSVSRAQEGHPMNHQAANSHQGQASHQVAGSCHGSSFWPFYRWVFQVPRGSDFSLPGGGGMKISSRQVAVGWIAQGDFNFQEHAIGDKLRLRSGKRLHDALHIHRHRRQMNDPQDLEMKRFPMKYVKSFPSTILAPQSEKVIPQDLPQECGKCQVRVSLSFFQMLWSLVSDGDPLKAQRECLDLYTPSPGTWNSVWFSNQQHERMGAVGVGNIESGDLLHSCRHGILQAIESLQHLLDSFGLLSWQ